MSRDLETGLAALGLEVDREGRQKLLAYLALLDKWNRVYNLTAIRAQGDMLTHHLFDSLALAPHLDRAAPASVLDVGSGGGLPGIPLAIVRPALPVTLIDAVAKKTAFLTQAKGELGLANLGVVTGRVQDFRPPGGFAAIVSRAFATLADFVRASRHLLAPGGRFYAMKGKFPEGEIAALPKDVAAAESLALSVPGVAAQRHLIVMEVR